MSFEDIEIYSGKKASDLFKDIVKDVEEKQTQIDVLIGELKPLIKNANDALLIVPLLKSYLEVGIKNNDERVKLASIIQKLMTAQQQISQNDNSLGLTDEEKEELLSEVQDITDEISSTSKEIKEEISEIKKEQKKITLNLGED